MNSFTTTEWEANPIADKTCDLLFKGNRKKHRNKNVSKKDINAGKVVKLKSKKTFKKLKNTFKEAQNILKDDENVLKSKPRIKKLKGKQKDIPLLSSIQTKNVSHDPVANKFKIKKDKVTHQTLFCQTSRKKYKQSKEISLDRNKKKSKQSRIVSKRIASKQDTSSHEQFSPKIAKKLKLLPLRERMLEKLKAARFRYLNEQMYTTSGADAKKYFENDSDAYQAYHDGYKQQVAQWPINPIDLIIQKIKKLPKTYIIADFGCGEAKLSKSVSQKVHSFDLVAANSSVTPCDMAHVPLDDNSIDVAVFCLSLMGTNLRDYLLEANRVLKVGGSLKIAEVESRFNNMDEFIKNVEALGFMKINKNLSHDLFCFIDFTKKSIQCKSKKKLPDIILEPCVYKKR